MKIVSSGVLVWVVVCGFGTEIKFQNAQKDDQMKYMQTVKGGSSSTGSWETEIQVRKLVKLTGDMD